MTREQCEKKIAEYLTAIRLTMLEYNPDFDYLTMSIFKSIDGNGNDNGNWDCYNIDAYNCDKEFPICFCCHKDIKDEKYWKCVTEADDFLTDSIAGYEGHQLADGTFFYSRKV